jgi:hypothetical protein
MPRGSWDSDAEGLPPLHTPAASRHAAPRARATHAARACPRLRTRTHLGATPGHACTWARTHATQRTLGARTHDAHDAPRMCLDATRARRAAHGATAQVEARTRTREVSPNFRFRLRRD